MAETGKSLALPRERGWFRREGLELRLPGDRAELGRTLADLSGRMLPFLPIGRGSRLGLGAPPGPVRALLSTAALRRITSLDPGDLTLGVEPGLGLAELEAALRAEGLAMEPGPFPPGRTLGGLWAEAPPTSRGFDRASLRSQVLGVRGRDARGRAFRSGGRVVKNVAGYDLGRLFVGSGGAFFLAEELQLRLVVEPEACLWLGTGALPRMEALGLWRGYRDRYPEARALDLCLDPDGSARVFMLLAGSRRGMAGLGLPPECSTLAEGGEAWWRGPEPSAPPGSPALLRGALLPGSLGDWLSALPGTASGRIHLQGSFELALEEWKGPVLPPGSHARLILNPGNLTLPMATSLSDPGLGAALRLKEVFGGLLAPGRLSFDTPAP